LLQSCASQTAEKKLESQWNFFYFSDELSHPVQFASQLIPPFQASRRGSKPTANSTKSKANLPQDTGEEEEDQDEEEGDEDKDFGVEEPKVSWEAFLLQGGVPQGWVFKFLPAIGRKWLTF